MKITIEPSEPNGGQFRTVIVDTNTNDDLTSDAVEAVLDAVIASTHNRKNVIEAAFEWAKVQSEVDEMS